MPRKTRTLRSPVTAALRFNEAAARCRGKHPIPAGGVTVRYGASMRPRPDAAENVRARFVSVGMAAGLQ